MSSRTWQMLVAALSIALMVFVLLKYGLRDEAPPTTKPASTQAHAGAQHHTEDITDPAIKHMGSQVAPVQAFAKAQVGDWIAYRVINRSTILPEEIATIVLSRITAATDTTVTVEYKGRMEKGGDRREEWTRERPRQGLTIDQLTGNDVSQWRLVDIQVADAKHEVGGRTFACKQINYAGLDPMFPSKKVRVTMWYSEEVPAGGLVEERDSQDLDTMHMEQIKQLIGFGTATATTWGTKPDGF